MRCSRNGINNKRVTYIATRLSIQSYMMCVFSSYLL